MFGISVPNVPQVNAAIVYDAMRNNKNVFLLDVRTPLEFSKGHLAESINIPVQDVSNKVESVIPDKNKTIYVYCLSGSRSVVAVESMMKLGYTNVFSMTSGLLAWRAKKFPLTEA